MRVTNLSDKIGGNWMKIETTIVFTRMCSIENIGRQIPCPTKLRGRLARKAWSFMSKMSSVYFYFVYKIKSCQSARAN